MSTTYAYLSMLRLLSEKELESFRDYLSTKYCNGNEKAKKLFEILYPNNATKLSSQFLREKKVDESPFSWKKNPFVHNEALKEKLFPLVFRKKYTKGSTNLDGLMTSSKTLLEDFLVEQKLKADKGLYNITLLEIFKNREGFDEFYQQKADKIGAKQQLNKESITSIEQLNLLFIHNQIDYGYKILVGKSDDESKQSFSEILESLNQYVITLYLKYSAEVLNRAEIFSEGEITSEESHIYLLEHILKLIVAKKEFYKIPVIFLYYKLVRCSLLTREIRQSQANIVKCNRLKKKQLFLYKEMKMVFLQQLELSCKDKKNMDNTDDLENIYDAIANYLVRKMDKEMHLMEDWSELTSAALKYGLIDFRGTRYIRIMRRTLKTIWHYRITNRTKSADLMQQEMNNFIEQNKMYIPDDKNSEVNLFVRGLELVYAIKLDANLRAECNKIALRLNMHAKSILLELSRRILLIQLWYRADTNMDSFEKMTESTITFLRDHKEINADRREAHLAFIRCIRHMDNCRSNPKKNKANIFKIIHNVQIIPLEKEWLINEANNL